MYKRNVSLHFSQPKCTYIHPTKRIKSKRLFSTSRQAFEEQLKRISIHPSDWYQLSRSTLDENTSKILKKEFNNSMYRALSTLFPEIEWHPWKFQNENVPKGFWSDINNIRLFFDDLGKQIGIQTLDDWYEKVSFSLIKENGGFRILNLFNGSPAQILSAAYPEHTWLPWKFKHVPVGFWRSIENQRKYFDWLGQQLGVKEMDDWYHKISQRVLKENGGGTVIQLYHGSPKEALQAIYPEHNWVSWRFNNVPVGFWNSSDNLSALISHLAEKLSIQTLDDWYLVSCIQLHQLGAWWLTKNQNLCRALKQLYPHHPWDPKRFQQPGKKTQRWLAVVLKKMFPDEEIREDYLHPKALLPSNANRPLQLDVFIPSKALAFEYQGVQHFTDVGFFSPSKTYQERDEEKRILCAQNNIKLVEVPYWWNRTQEGLQEIMKQYQVQ